MATDKLKPAHLLTNEDARRIATQAGNVATFLASSTALTSVLEHAVKIDFENKLTTAEVHFELFGMDEMSPERLQEWPEVGSIEGYTGNKPFDLYSYKDADGKKQDGSFWRGVIDRHPVVIQWNGRIRLLTEAGKDGAPKSNPFVDWSQHDRDAEKSDLQGKVTTFGGKLKMAVQLYHKMAEANDRMAGVITVDYETKPVMENGKVKIVDGQMVTEIDKASPRIIVVSDLARKGVAKRYTIANFLRLSVDVAKQNGGTYAAFITSNKREADGADSEDTATTGIKVASPKDFEDASIAVKNFITEAKNNSSAFRTLVAYYTEKDADDRILTLFDMAEELTNLTGRKDLKDRYDAIVLAEQTAKAAATKAAA